MTFIAASDRKQPEREIKTPRIAKPRRTPSTRVAELKRAVRDAERANNKRNAEIINSFKLNSPNAGNDPAERMTAPKALDTIALQDFARSNANSGAITGLTLEAWQERKSRERIERREAAEKRTDKSSLQRTVGSACDSLTVRVAREFDALNAENRAQLRARIAEKLNANVQCSEAQRAINAANFHRSRELLGLEYDIQTKRAIMAIHESAEAEHTVTAPTLKTPFTRI